jgi:Rne/Rng family ribonuclease
MSGISRRLTENERSRLKSILKNHLPDEEGVIIRTAAEGATAEEIEDDIKRLKAQWEDIETKSKNPATAAPTLLYSEPDLTVRVIRDIFNEEFNSLIVQGNDAWDDINNYLGYIAPELTNKLEKWSSKDDLFAVNRVDEQLAKAFDRKVYLPSGGSLVIDRTEAMVVVDVNTGKFIGKGGNLEETVTKNNLEAAEEIARQLRLRDLGGIIVIDFIDMTLESNRELVLRRLIECLGRDRTKHQVAEVTSLGLVQMTRKRVGQGLIEAFSTPCEHCNGRGIHIHTEPVKKVALDKDLDKPTFSSKDFEKRSNRNSNSDEENDVEVEVDTFFDEAEADTANSQAESEELEKSPVAEQENSSAGNSPIGGNQRKAKKRRVVSSGGVVTPNLEA